jgi:hypothetical protein
VLLVPDTISEPGCGSFAPQLSRVMVRGQDRNVAVAHLHVRGAANVTGAANHLNKSWGGSFLPIASEEARP